MAYLKVLKPSMSPLTDLLGPLPTEDEWRLPVIVDPTEARTRAVLLGRLEEGVKSSPAVTLVLPPSLLDLVADQVLLLANDEPCGLRGCLLTVRWCDDLGDEQLCQVKADAVTPTTHKLDLTLRPDPTSWYTKMSRIFRSLGKRRMVVSPKFDLIKQRLYHFED